MGMYEYAVWFRDTTLKPEDQDHEWVACIAIEAESADKALEWGDHLARGMTDRNPTEAFLRSSVSDLGTGTGATPRAKITFGTEATDLEIGW